MVRLVMQRMDTMSDPTDPMRCQDYEHDPAWPGCCPSCHDDWAYGYGDPEEGSGTFAGRPFEVCCQVMNWLDECESLEGS